MKYKNKNGIELNFEGHKNDTFVNLTKEVVSKACEMINNNKNKEAKLFLEKNFAINVSND